LKRRAALLGLPAFSALLGGCAGLDEWAYRARQFNGHIDLINRSRPVAEWLANPATPERTRAALQRAQALRAFAVTALALPDNASYQRYTALDADSVVWNVVATPAHSLTLRTWCAPVMGCVGYRGHFDRARADAQARELAAAGWDVHSYGVPAYSTLGWSNPLGGDPLLSSFLHWREADLARLLFHEMAHQRAYAADDSGFNESYATAVERLGLAAWRQAQGTPPDPAADADDQARERRRARWHALALGARADLLALYASDAHGADKVRGKTERFARLRADLAALVAQDAGYQPYATWAQGANNAHLALVSAYQLQVPAFEALFDRLGRDWPRFHAEVARLAKRPKAERQALGLG
jgi:predicted aminopeptidase